jgi:hypothetical protein
MIEWMAIDGRNMMLDSPAMSMAFLTTFTPESRAPHALLLRHRAAALPIGLTPIAYQPFQADRWVEIPRRNQLVAMSIRLRQNLFGTLMTNLYRQDAVYIDLETSSAAVRHFRVPPQVLETPGLINYVPDSLDEMEKLWQPEPLQNRLVRVRLSGPGLRWTKSTGYNFYRVENAGAKLSN